MPASCGRQYCRGRQPFVQLGTVAFCRNRSRQALDRAAPILPGRHNRTLQPHSVVFAGFIQGEFKHGAFAAAELFALPSMHENFGIAVVEALAYGLPALVTPEVASHVYVDRSGAGITVEGNTEAIADGLKKLLEGDGSEMAGRGRPFVEQNLSWSSTVEQLGEVYRECLGQKTNRDKPPQ